MTRRLPVFFLPDMPVQLTIYIREGCHLCDDMELALQYGVLLTWIDGEQSADEVTQLDKLISLLGFTREEAQPVLDSASAFAQTLLPELES